MNKNDRQGMDRNPAEENARSEKVTKVDLKGKKIDGDPSKEEGRPASKED